MHHYSQRETLKIDFHKVCKTFKLVMLQFIRKREMRGVIMLGFVGRRKRRREKRAKDDVGVLVSIKTSEAAAQFLLN